MTTETFSDTGLTWAEGETPAIPAPVVLDNVTKRYGRRRSAVAA